MKFSYEDLKTIAAHYCIKIYEDFDEAEIIDETMSVQNAWEIGKDLKESVNADIH